MKSTATRRLTLTAGRVGAKLLDQKLKAGFTYIHEGEIKRSWKQLRIRRQLQTDRRNHT
jgi:hypothetical protein